MRLLVLIMLLLGACSLSSSASQLQLGCDYNNLARVASEAAHANGKTLCAELYSYSRHGFLAYYDKPVHDTDTALKKEALLIKEEDAARNFPDGYPKDGQRVLVRGVIRLQRSCYAKKNSCIPVLRPIYLESPHFTKIDR